MNKILLILAFLITGFGADAAPRVGGANNVRAGRGGDTTPTTTTTAARGRAATQTPTAPTTRTTITSSQSAQRTSGNTASTGGTSSGAVVVSRAAKQSVISTGTKVTAAAQNTVVDEKCWNGFMGCMDSFCMLDNANGGRCICSDKNAEYDSILAEIQSLDEQSYQMATVGVEQIEMGDDAKAVMDKTNSVTKRIEKDSQSKRQSLDLSAWNSATEIDFDADVEDIFSLASDGTSITNKTGDALYRAAAKLCNAQIPECKSQSTMMELMYKQRIRSDCTAYENSLRQQRTQSAQKLASAQSAMREAALEQYRNANKYDLGQCTVQFKQCMQTTGGCGDDFSGCVDYSVRESLTKTNAKSKTIKGTSSKITLLAATYDVLEAKKELCMSVTQQCVNVRDQVWDTFLREVAPQVKSAELMAESNMRTSCISNIANCFQKACKENMDPNDPDGSYDMCLTRPETLRSACKVEIDPCEGAIPNIMTYVTARLASMRVDSCTKEFKQCLTSEDRCGTDYTQCIGLDTDTIVRMCPRDKLVGCYNSKKPDADVYDELAEIATGIFLSIDNNMLSACQKALDTAMIKVCGSTENCDDLVVDNGAGTRSFKYEVCHYNGFETATGQDGSKLPMPKFDSLCYDSLDGVSQSDLTNQADGQGWAGRLSGLVYWGEISYNTDKNQFTTEQEYMKALKDSGFELNEDEKQVVHDRVFGTEIKALTNAVATAINTIESDQVVQYCMTGREFQGYQKILGSNSKDNPRFPNLTRQIRQIIAASALKNARDNYMEKYDTEIERMMKDQVKAAQRIDENAAKVQAAQSCENWKASSSLPETKAPKASNAGKWVAIGIIAAVAVVASIFTFGGSAFAGGSAIAAIIASIEAGGIGSATIAAATTTAVALGASTTAAVMAANVTPVDKVQVEQWNYKMSADTTFNWETGECIKTVVTQDCEKTKKNDCEDWADPVETVTSINLLN
ncbi:MAG: hypothetical protein J5620_04575 [Alphaproteobacteria bacterium]|nr:hypothetical protein [Alphaproteobacteria bacterium]